MLKSKKIIALLVSLVLILSYSSVKAKDQTADEFITFSPKNEKIESVEILKWNIIVVDEKGNEVSMTYDVKRDMYF